MTEVPRSMCHTHQSARLTLTWLVSWPREGRSNGGREEVWRSDEPMDKLAVSQEAVEGPLPRVTARSHTAPLHFPKVLFLLLDSCFCSYEWLMLCAADWCFLTSFICMSEWTLKGLWFSIVHTFWEKNITVLKNYLFTCHNFTLTYSVLPPVFHSSSLFKLHPTLLLCLANNNKMSKYWKPEWCWHKWSSPSLLAGKQI